MKPSNSGGYTSFDEEEMKGHEGGHHRTSFDTFGGPTPEGSSFLPKVVRTRRCRLN